MDAITVKQERTHWVKIFISGPIEVGKQTLRKECLRQGLCVTVEPTTFIYTGGEEAGYVVGLINYPRFPTTPEHLWARAIGIAEDLMRDTHQHSVLLMDPTNTQWISRRPQA
jgi:hypothetical protein